MPDYISKFTGNEIDDYLQKTKDINKNASEVNSALDFVDKTVTNVNSAGIGEVMAKSADGTIEGTGIINESDKIFFPKDGRFPSASIDIGPCITISENGGWVQNTADTLGKSYLMLDYEIDKTGTKRPTYWERAAEEINVVINPANQTTMNNVTTFSQIPSVNSQVNALYMQLANAVTNLRIEIISLITNKPIKYIPNEASWRNGIGGLNLNVGINDLLQGDLTTPLSLLTSYSLRFNLKADGPINIMGDGIHPYIAVNRQIITAKGILLQDEGIGAESAEAIRNKLSALQGLERMSYNILKDTPEIGSRTFIELEDTPNSYIGESEKLLGVNITNDGIEFISKELLKDNPQSIKLKLETLLDSDRLAISAIKNTEPFTIQEKEKLLSIERGAEVNNTASEIKILYESNINTNPFMDNDKNKLNSIIDIGSGEIITAFERNKLNGIESGAQVNPTSAGIKTLYESNLDTNAFTDILKSKLLEMQTGAEVNIQADWLQLNNLLDDFIKNKPVIYNSFGGGYFINAVTTVMATSNTDYKVVATFVPWTMQKDFFWDSTNKRFVYTGQTAYLSVFIEFSASASASSSKMKYCICVNGIEQTGIQTESDFASANKIQRLGTNGQLSLNTNDYIEFCVQATTNITSSVSKCQLSFR